MKKLLFLFVVVTLINAVIFFYRDHFQYIDYSSYAELYKECDQDCRNKWDDFLIPYSPAAINEARSLMKDLPFDSTSTLTNLKLIGQHLHGNFHKQAGYPQDIIHFSDPVDQYKILSADSTQKIWCGTWSLLVSFFGWSHNIISRNVEIMKPGDSHVLNECYLPERKQWVMVDLTNNIVLAAKGNRLLNTQDFLKALSQPDSVTVLTGNGTMVRLNNMNELPAIRNYYQNRYPYYYYHLTHAGVVYSTGAKLKRYFLPDSWYEIFSLSPKIALLFYVKLFFIAIWMILGSLILVKRYYD